MERARQVGAAAITCAEAAELVSAYLGGDLGPRAADVVAHLETCRSCGMGDGSYERLKARLERETAL